ncbi:MAG: HypC/HybG/HupF family hydrogenase formation chaperone [Pseudonocardia sp.]
MNIPVAARPVDKALDKDLSADLASASLVLARRFADGATLWCVAPVWEPHAQHVAVEFVHPVIVGKKALPAVALTGPDLVATVRVSVRPGDVVLAVAAADDPAVRSVMRRAPAWGVTTLWIGSGARPAAGSADHVLWIDDPDPRLPATGGFVLLYHLLWELTHVCFEHPGLLSPAPPECTEEVCITCSDEGRLGEVITPGADGMARVRTAEGAELVATMLIDPVQAGDLLLVHAGMAITKLDEEAAR